MLSYTDRLTVHKSNPFVVNDQNAFRPYGQHLCAGPLAPLLCPAGSDLIFEAEEQCHQSTATQHLTTPWAKILDPTKGADLPKQALGKAIQRAPAATLFAGVEPYANPIATAAIAPKMTCFVKTDHRAVKQFVIRTPGGA